MTTNAIRSPWAKGGYVNSQVFDHTSLIRFLEARFDVEESNITPWRRGVAGDLTSVFNFAEPPRSYTVEPGSQLSDIWGVDATGYDLSVCGPNGFMHTFKGSQPTNGKSRLNVKAIYDNFWRF